MIDLRPLIPLFNGKPVAILGLGKSGMPVHAACVAAGIETVLWDDNAEARMTAKNAGATLKNMAEEDFSAYACLCLSPGIPFTHPTPHPAVLRAQKAGIPVLGDIELFHMAMPQARTIGITGTNGKSTTTALIGHILEQAHMPCAIGGNIGTAVLTLPALPLEGVYVLELSSYQIDLCPTFSPDIALLINISPDHLDRHGGMDGYTAVKKKIFRKNETAVIGIDDEWSRRIYRAVAQNAHKTIAVSCAEPLTEGISVSQDGLLSQDGRVLFDVATCPALQGAHNWQNAGMAFAACLSAGVPADKIMRGMKSFTGLAHRQKTVAVQNGIRYINDSKATNDQAAAMALRTFNPIYWIAGGKPKDGGYADCEQHLSHLRHTFLIGEAQNAMAAWLKAHDQPYTLSGTLDEAVKAAHEMAQGERLKDAVVLLSPACASFDQFKSFEHRGDVFTRLAQDATARRPA